MEKKIMPGPWEKFQPAPKEPGPWDKFAKKDAGPSAGASFANQAGNAGLMGYGPEIVAGAAKLVQPLVEKVTGQPSMLPSYTQMRDDEYKQLKKDEETNPVASTLGKVVGTGATLLPTGAAATGFIKGGAKLLPRMARAGTLGAGLGAVSNPGAEEGVIAPFQPIDRVKNAGVGFVTGAALQGAGEAIPKAIRGAGNMLRNKANTLADAATGATGKQASGFAPGTGKELLERKMIKLLDTPGKVAQRLETALDASGKGIEKVLAEVDAAGIKIDRNELVAALKKKLAEVSADESQAGVAKKLQGIIDTVETKAAERLPSQVEKIKRNFQRQSNYAKPNTTQANKITASVYRQSVEDAAGKLGPDKLTAFKDEKALTGLLTPVRDAAEKRAMQLQQSPKGGFLDTMAGFIGMGAGGWKAAIPSAIARRVVAPRINSTLAVTADALGKVLQKTPGALGEFAEPLLRSQMAGPQQFQAQVYKLIRDPKFLEVARNPVEGEVAKKKK